MSPLLAALIGFVVGALAGGGAVYGWLRGRVAPQATARTPVAAEPVQPSAGQDEEVRAALAASRATLEELEGRYRGRRASGPEEGEKPARRRGRKT